MNTAAGLLTMTALLLTPPGAGGYFKIALPVALLAGNPKVLSLRWIDFYR